VLDSRPVVLSCTPSCLVCQVFTFTVADDSRPDTEALFDKFQAFLTRAMSCSNIFGGDTSATTSQLLSQSQGHRMQNCTGVHAALQIHPQKRQVVLLEDLPNLLHAPTQARFQAALQSLCVANKSSNPGPPVVIIVSDSGLRAEQPDDDTWDGGNSGRRWGRPEDVDIRTVLGSALLASPYVTCIGCACHKSRSYDSCGFCVGSIPLRRR